MANSSSAKCFTTSKITIVTKPRGENSLLEFALRLGQQRTSAGFITETLSVLSEILAPTLLSFNRIDFPNKTATVSIHPLAKEQGVAFEEVSRLIDHHPIYSWHTKSSDWNALRITDVVPKEEWLRNPLAVEVLRPIGATFGLFIHLKAPADGYWLFFAASRSDRDFSDVEIQSARALQPVLVALYACHHASHASTPGGSALTARERAILGLLADGLTATAMAHRLGSSPATIRKHVEHIYRKLDCSDRLGAVVKGQERGYLLPEDVSRSFRWNANPPVQQRHSGKLNDAE